MYGYNKQGNATGHCEINQTNHDGTACTEKDLPFKFSSHMVILNSTCKTTINLHRY